MSKIDRLARITNIIKWALAIVISVAIVVLLALPIFRDEPKETYYPENGNTFKITYTGMNTDFFVGFVDRNGKEHQLQLDTRQKNVKYVHDVKEGETEYVIIVLPRVSLSFVGNTTHMEFHLRQDAGKK